MANALLYNKVPAAASRMRHCYHAGLTVIKTEANMPAESLLKRLSRYLLRGALTLMPFGLTLYVLYLFLVGSEAFARLAVEPLLGSFYVPGMGLLLGIVGIVILGFIVSHPLMDRVFALIEMPFNNIPIVRSVYSALKSLADYFAPQSQEAPRQVVLVRFPGGFEIIGFLTRDNLQSLPEGIEREQGVAVYFPMSYMVGGYTAFVPRSSVTPIAMSVEEAMRSSLVAWMPGGERNDKA